MDLLAASTFEQRTPQGAQNGCNPMGRTKEPNMLKVLGGTVGIIFLIGLAVVVGILVPIF